jgi:hypothetical protein
VPKTLDIKNTCDIIGSEFSDGTGTRNNDQRTLEMGKKTIPLPIVHSIFNHFPNKRRNKGLLAHIRNQAMFVAL